MKFILFFMLCAILGAEELLMHFDGQGSSFVDSSGRNHIISVTGNVTQTTATSVSGGKSAYFDGSSYLSIATPNSFAFASGSDYTIDFWMKSSSNNRMHALSFGIMGTDNIDFDFNDAGALWLYHNSTGANAIIPGSIGEYTNNQWHHVAAVRRNGTITAYIDGVSQGTLYMPAEMNGSSTVYIGTCSYYSYGHNFNFTGYIDELRIVKGQALFTNNFDPTQNIPSSVPEPGSLILLLSGCLFLVYRKL
mgnify:CR=1 FL=1